MKKLIPLFLLLITSSYVSSQLEWAGLISSDDRSMTNALAVDNNDDIITVGEFRGTTDFDFGASSNNITAQGSQDMFISKYDQNNNLLWAISMGSTDYERIDDVAIDNNNNIYITGGIDSPTIDMDPGAGTSNISGKGFFIAKYDASGNHLWSFGTGTNTASGTGIDVDNSGNIYVTGVLRGATDMDPGAGTATITPNGDRDAFVAKYTDNGDYLWAFNLGSSGNDTDGKAIKCDENGNFYVGGRFEGDVDFDPGAGTNTVSGDTFLPDGFVAKYTENMDFLWVVNYSNGSQNRVNSLDVDYSSGDVLVGGYFQGDINFNPNGTPHNVNTTSSNGFIARYFANSGELDWLRHIEGSADPIGISIDQTGTVWTSGFFSSTVDFDYPNNQNLTGAGFASIFVAQYDITNGDFICVYDFGNSNYNESRGIDNFSNNNAVFGGNFEGAIDFDPGPGTNTLTSAGGYNTAIVKVNETCPIISPLTADFTASNTEICEGDTITFTDNSTGSVSSWNWTFNGGDNMTSSSAEGPHDVTFTTGGTYDITLEVGDGGSNTDTKTTSITVNSPTTGTDTQTACESFTWTAGNGNTYTSSNNTATDTIFGGAANGCDSIVTLDLTINNVANGTDSQTACGDFTWIDGNTYSSSNNTATHTIPGGAANGCDSIVTLDLTISNVATGTDVQTACESYDWIDGNTYTSSNNTATHTIPNGSVHGCDSIVTLDLTINNVATGTDSQTACDDFTWIDGNTYSSSNNTATHTISNGSIHGCDSIVTLDLTINNVATGTDSQTACDDFTWIDGNTYSSSNNTATHTIPGGAANGCDSIVTLDLTISNVVTGTDVQTACGDFTWIDGNTYSSSNNTATHTIPNGSVHGCDSIVTLDLTIQSLPNITASSNASTPICENEELVFNVTTVNGATYEWSGPNGFTSQVQNPTINSTNANGSGTYRVIASTGNNCADTAEVDVNVYPLPVLDITADNDSCASEVGQIVVNAYSPNTPLTYAWSNGSNDSIITGLSEGNYSVTVTDTASCSASESIQIHNNIADCDCFVYVPNAFSPNGDNNNDLLFVRGDCVSYLSFKVFNRWGNQVFETHELMDGWNGTYQGEPQNTGVFVYKLEATFENGKTVEESGDINLIR